MHSKHQVISSAVKQLVEMNHIQNKSFYLHNICAFIIYKYTQMHVYILEKCYL